MDAFIAVFLIFCWTVSVPMGGSGPHGVSTSSNLHLVGPGDDVVLPCNLTFNRHTMWFRQQSEDMIHLTTTTRDNLNNSTIDEFHIDDNDRLSLYLDNHTKSISLKIIRVKESDQGWYYCTEWEAGAFRFGKGVRLAFSGGSGPHGVSTASDLYLVQPGDDVVLPCNIILTSYTLWFHQQSEDLIHLTTTTRDNLGNSTIDVHHIHNTGHFPLYFDNHTKSMSLKIVGTEDSDQGLYYCADWEAGVFHFGKGVRLAFAGSSSVQTGWKVLGMFLATLPFITATAAAVWAHGGGGAVGISQ